MNKNTLTKENLSLKLLSEILDAAFMQFEFEKDSLIVREENIVSIDISEAKDRINFMTMYGFVEDTPEDVKLKAINKMNNEYIMASCSFSDDTLFITYDFLVNDGLTYKNFILTLKQFLGLPSIIVNNCAKDIIQ